MHKSQIFFYTLLSFIGGVFAGSFFNPSKNTVLIAAVFCALLISIFYRRDSKLLNPRLAFISFLSLFFLAGVLHFNTTVEKTRNIQKFAEAQNQVVDPSNKHPIKVYLLGYISDQPEVKGNKQVFPFYAKKLIADKYLINTDEKILVTTDSYPIYKYGDRLQIFGNVKTPENFNDFDYKSYLAKDGVFTVLSYPEIKKSSSGGVLSKYDFFKIDIFKSIFAIKDIFEKSVSKSVSEPNASFINGILLGSRSQIPQDLKDDFSRTGISHVLAVSGYNITIIASIISSIFLLFLRRQTAFWFSLVAVLIFTILTGAQASVVRAAIMGMLVLLARREGRLSDPRNAIVLVGAIMVLVNPLVLRYDIGFQLSFAATLGIIYLVPIIEKYFSKFPNFFDFRETLTMTISAQILVLPLLLYYFKNFSVTSLPTNLIVLPTIPFAMILGFASGIGGLLLPFLGKFIGYFAWLFTTIELNIIKFFAAPSWATLSIQLNWWEVVLVYALLVAVMLRLKNRANSKEGSAI